MSTFTVTKQLEQPARGSDVGTWDTPLNGDMGIIDAALAQIVTIGLNNSNIILSAPQFQCKEIVFNSTLTGNVTITFPTSFTGPYTIQNICTGSSAFTITLATTAVGQSICCPPQEIFDCWNDGTNLKYRNFGRIGTYMDYAGSSVPSWISGCTLPPYLNCDGTTFSSASYPALFMILGGTALPDSRGRYRATLNQGTGRITSSQTGVDGNTLSAAGGSVMISSQNLPSTALGDPGHAHTAANTNLAVASGVSGFASLQSPGLTGNSLTGITFGSSSPTGFVPPTVMGGITLVRAG